MLYAPLSTAIKFPLESKVFGIGLESYTVGSNEFCVGYSVQHQKLPKLYSLQALLDHVQRNIEMMANNPSLGVTTAQYMNLSLIHI